MPQNHRPGSSRPPAAHPPSLLGLTAQPRVDPPASLARCREACCSCLRGSSATPRYLRDPCEHHACQQLARRRELAWVRRAFWGSQLNQGLTPQLLLHAIGRLAVNVFEGPARCRATCWILVNIMPVNSWPGVANWRESAEPCGVDSSTEDQPNIFPCAASRFFYDARV